MLNDCGPSCSRMRIAASTISSSWRDRAAGIVPSSHRRALGEVPLRGYDHVLVRKRTRTWTDLSRGKRRINGRSGDGSGCTWSCCAGSRCTHGHRVPAAIPCGDGHFARQHRVARHARRSRIHRRGFAVGGHRVPVDLRRVHAPRREDRRSVGASKLGSRRVVRLRGGEHRRRMCRERRGSRRRAGGAGCRGSAVGSGVVGAGGYDRRPGSPRTGDGPVGRCRCGGRCAGRGAQWGAHAVVVVASGSPRQRPDHCHRDGRCAARNLASRRRTYCAARCSRRGHRDARRCCPCLCSERWWRSWVGIVAGSRRIRRGCSARRSSWRSSDRRRIR